MILVSIQESLLSLVNVAQAVFRSGGFGCHARRLAPENVTNILSSTPLIGPLGESNPVPEIKSLKN